MRGTELTVGLRVRALTLITESDFPPGSPPGHIHTHAEAGDLGVIEDITPLWFIPTVRFDRTGTATVVALSEIEPADSGPRVFVADGDNVICPDCLTPREKEHLGDLEVEAWEEGSAGWTSPPMCDRCGVPIHVVVWGPPRTEGE